MGDSQIDAANLRSDTIRGIFAFLDRPAFWLLGLVYELFFNVASADLFANDTIFKFYGRVQLILGVFMMFQLALTILKGIMNPDTFTDKKTGAGNVIMRIATSLVLLTLLVPFETGNSNEFEKQISNNGLLFGSLYSLQHRLLSNNTLGRLILGTDGSSNYFSDDDDDDSEENLKTSARIFTSTILKGFYRINLIPESERNPNHTQDTSKDPAVYNENRVCKDIDDDMLAAYTRLDADPGEIIDMVNVKCSSGGALSMLQQAINGYDLTSIGNGYYVLAYNGFISMIVAFVFVFILLSFTVEVAIRGIKLAVLRLLAPIPIISYMDPKGSKDSAFNAWVKTLTSTYIDLFVRLAAVYFVIFLIQDMITNGIVIKHGTGALGVISWIIIWIALFIFAKQAPKFVRKIFGLKEDGGTGLFSGFSQILSAGAVGAGVLGGAISNGIATAGKVGGTNKGKKLLAGIGGGILGGVTGGYAAGSTFMKSKDFDSKAIMNQVRARNLKNYSNAADDSTFFGRLAAGAQANFGLKNEMAQMDDKIKYYGIAESAMKRISNAFDGNGDYKFTYTGPTIKDSNNKDILKTGDKTSTKDLNDLCNFYSSDGKAAKELDALKKKHQGLRFAEIRKFKTREDLEAAIKDPTQDYTASDLVIYDSAQLMYKVAQKYKSEPEFTNLGSVSFDYSLSGKDAGKEWGSYWKHDAASAGKTAEQIKNSEAYSKAKANAQRAEESQKKGK